MEYTKTFDHPASSESICLVLEASDGVWTLVYASAKGDAGKSGKICEVDWESNQGNWKMALESHPGDSRGDQRYRRMDLETGDS